MSTRLRMSHLAYPVTALGPGSRLAIWVAGCPLRCPDCITPELQRMDAGRSIPVYRLADHILRLPVHLQGVTFTGGEPFTQAGALTDLWALLSEARPRWDLLIFSGHGLAELQARGGAGAALLAHTDILIDGPYLRGRQIAHPLRASANQRIHYLSARGRILREACEDGDADAANLGIGRRHGGWLIGILDPRRRRQLHRDLGIAKGVRVR